MSPQLTFLAFKKRYKLFKLGGGGVEVIWTKSKRTAAFFSGNLSLLTTGPETSEVVLVSAAHCNFICKVICKGSRDGFISCLSRMRMTTLWRSAAAETLSFQNHVVQGAQQTARGAPIAEGNLVFVLLSHQS